MASSRNTSNGPDWKDVVRAANEYAREWGGVVTIVLSPYGSDKLPAMTVIARLYADQTAAMGAKPLASASVSLNGGAGGALSAAALSALYELDKELYRQQIGVSGLRR